MRIHRQNGLPGPPAGRADHTTDDQSRRLRWRPRRQDRGGAPRAPESDAGGDQAVPVRALPVREEPGETMADAVQLVIALFTAGLDSPELEAWAAHTLTPLDADGLADFMAGLHVTSRLLLSELHEATGEPPGAILQRLAILAEQWRGTSSAG